MGVGAEVVDSGVPSVRKSGRERKQTERLIDESNIFAEVSSDPPDVMEHGLTAIMADDTPNHYRDAVNPPERT